MAESNQQSLELSCDDSYLSLLTNADDEEQQTDSIMSDQEFAEQLQFQEALMSSILNSKNKSCFSQTVISITEKGESSGTKNDESSQILCEICDDKKPYDDDMFNALQCVHRYCIECVAKHIAVKVQKSVQGTTTFACPGLECESFLDIENCRGVLPKYVLLLWDNALCEGMIDESQKFYCPYKDCSGLMILGDGDEVIRESECPFCHRLFCAECKVPWHSGYPCEEFMKFDKNERTREDLMVRDLAKAEKWQRCSRCKFFVEKRDGCLHMNCRCGHEFCYACGKTWTSSHGGCQ